jgi:hypothetical protein
LAPGELDVTAVWGRVQRLRAAAAPAPRFLHALDGETIHKLADRGFLMAIDAGQLLTKKDLVQRELFVVLDGTFEIYDGDRRLGSGARGSTSFAGRIRSVSRRDRNTRMVRDRRAAGSSPPSHTRYA